MQANMLFTKVEHEALEFQEYISPAAADSVSYGTFMRVKLEQYTKKDKSLILLLRWLYANAEFSAAALATNLSLTRWADDDDFEFSGEHVWLPGMFSQASWEICVLECHYLGNGQRAITANKFQHGPSLLAAVRALCLR
jgi:hypothetical protein